MIPDPKSAGWALDPQLERDTVAVGDMPLCRVLLINDANYPWLLLVPRRRRHRRDHRSRRHRAGATDERDRRTPRARSRRSPAATRSTSPRSATWCRSSMSMSSRARAATPPGRSRSGTQCRRAPTRTLPLTSCSHRCASGWRYQGKYGILACAKSSIRYPGANSRRACSGSAIPPRLARDNPCIAFPRPGSDFISTLISRLRLAALDRCGDRPRAPAR